MPSASNPMQQAVFRGCVECIRMLVETPPYYSVDASCGPDGLRPIHIAAREGHIQTLRFLSSAGACLQRADFGGCTALHHASTAGQLRAVRWLLRHGAKILLDKRGRSPIQVAADHDFMEIVNVLSKHATTGSNANSSLVSSNNQSRESIQRSVNGNNNNIYDPLGNISGSRRNNIGLSDKDKDSSDFTTGSVDDYSLSSQLNNNNINNRSNNNLPSSKPFSHLHLSSSPIPPSETASSKIQTSPGDCASSSGNSSLSASTSAPSLSPSASSSSAVSCGCSTSDETTLVKSVVEEVSSDSFTLAEYQSHPPSSGNFASSENSLTPNPFYLHPPSTKKSLTSFTLHETTRDEEQESVSANDNDNNVIDAESGKKKSHKRQGSIVNSSNSPFFLHPPENLVSETQKAVVAKMAPAPVNPSHSHHHFADTINEPTPKLKVGLGNDHSSSSTSSSPPLSPPGSGSKNGLPNSAISDCINKFQTSENHKPLRRSNSAVNQISNKSKSPTPAIVNTSNNSNDAKLKSQSNVSVNNNNSFVPPPPPPPLPPPFPTSNSVKNNCPLPNVPKDFDIKISSPSGGRNSKNEGQEMPENDYEDIEEFGKNHYEHTRKLLRSVSAPSPAHDTEQSNGPINAQNIPEEKSQVGHSSNSVYERGVIASKPPVGCGKAGVPFIPPHFPTPPQDALIKPSEYLRSIQNKPKSTGAGNNNNNCNGTSGITPRPISRVEETLKALGVGVHDNHGGLMSPVPEETNAEDEFEEINPERINGFSIDTNNNFETDENNNTTHAISSPAKGGGGLIKAEELMKVHLRKTPMSRTKSAPPLGRVLPDDQVDQSPNMSNENIHEPLKRTNTCNNTTTGGTESTGSKAAVIAELAQSSQVGGVREWKEELKRRQKEQEKAVQKEIEQFYQPVNFVAEVPSMDVTGAPIPDWKRQMMARKAAERARKEAEEQRRLEIEAKRMAAIPDWKRQMMARKGVERAIN